MSIVIVGNGMVGARLCDELARRGLTAREPVVVFGEEPDPAYDRVHLTDLFETEAPVEDLVLHSRDWYAQAGIDLRTKERVERIDPRAQCLTTSNGATIAYDKLVLATGSRPVVPELPGLGREHARVYRTAEDREAIAQYAKPGMRVAIVGAGLLGLELADALSRRGTSVTLLERAPRLLPRHLDRTAAEILSDAICSLGIDVRVGFRPAAMRRTNGGGIEIAIEGEAPLVVDLVVATAGVRPRDDLARRAGVACDPRGGVLVDDRMQTSEPSVYGVGECVVHEGVHYGVVAPGYAMAEVVARRLAGEDARFEAVPFSARLELDAIAISVLGESSAGDPGSEALSAVGVGIYRRLLLREGRLIGAIAVGEWDALPRLQDAIARRERVGVRERRRFARSAEIFRTSGTRPIGAWADHAIVCTCTGVTCGALRAAHGAGRTSVAALATATGASTVCGTCTPLLAELCGALPVSAPARSGSLVAAAAAGAVAACALLLLGPIPLSDSVQTRPLWDALWTSSFARQVTGFSLAFVAIASAALSLRKRWSRVTFGRYTGWRVAHTWIGALTVALAGLHTGMSLGSSLNRALMLSFLALAGLGVGAAVVTALERRWGPEVGGRLRRGWALAHILALCPFGVLLGSHVFKVYYF